MPTFARRIVLAAMLVLAMARLAGAHNIGESNATFYVRSAGIDVELYMGMPSACRLIAEPGQIIQMTANNFSDFTDALQACAPELFVVTDGQGAVLKPDAMAVSMTDQSDVLYNLHYPLPAALPGVLNIRATYLDKMVDTHIATTYVMNSAGDQFGWASLGTDSEVMQVRLPAAGDLMKTQAVVASATQAIADVDDHRAPRWIVWAAVGAGVAIVAVIFFGWVWKSSRRRSTH